MRTPGRAKDGAGNPVETFHPRRRDGGRPKVWRWAIRPWAGGSSSASGAKYWTGTNGSCGISPKSPSACPSKAWGPWPRISGGGGSKTGRAGSGGSQGPNRSVCTARRMRGEQRSRESFCKTDRGGNRLPTPFAFCSPVIGAVESPDRKTGHHRSLDDETSDGPFSGPGILIFCSEVMYF